MKWNIKTVSIVLAVVAVAGFAAGAALLLGSGDFGPGRAEDIRETESFAIQGVASVIVDTIDTAVRWHTVDGDRIRVVLHGRTNRPAYRPVLRAGLDGDALSIRVRPKRTIHIGFDLTRTVLEIYVPREVVADVDLRTVSGDVRIDAMRARSLRIRTISGDVAAGDLAAEKTSFETASGDWTEAGAPGGFTCRTISGDVDLRFVSFDGDVRINSTSGEIRLDLPEGADFSLEATSVSGDITSGFPTTVTGGRGRRTLAGTVGRGLHRIVIRTISGDVWIQKHKP